MKHVRIYTTPWCGYCIRAKALLREHHVPFEEIDVSGEPELRRWLVEVTGRRTVPQIFFDDEAIGGCDDLQILIAQGRLDERLGRA